MFIFLVITRIDKDRVQTANRHTKVEINLSHSSSQSTLVWSFAAS